MYVVAVGAQVPDTIQAVAVARRGMGSMAVASATGSQVINILIGLGLPWQISTSFGKPVRIMKHAELAYMSRFMFGCVAAYVAVLLLPTIPSWGRRGRATLGKREGWILIAVYFAVVGLYALATSMAPGDGMDA